MRDTIEIKLMDHCQEYEINTLLEDPANFIDFLLTLSQLGSRLLNSNGAYRRKVKDCRNIIRECREFLFTNTVLDFYTNATYACQLADWQVQNMMEMFPGFFNIINETISIRTFMDHMPCHAVENIYHWCGLAKTRFRDSIEIQVVAKLVELYCIMNASTRQLNLETAETGEYFDPTREAVDLLYQELREDLRYCMNQCNNGQVDIQSLLRDFHNILSDPTNAIIGAHISEGNSSNKHFFNSVPYVEPISGSEESKLSEEPRNNRFLELVRDQKTLFRSEVMDERELYDRIRNIGSALDGDEITVNETIEILSTLSPHGKTLLYYLRFHRTPSQEAYLKVIKNIYEKENSYSLPGQIWGGSTDYWQLDTDTQTISINDQWDRCSLLNQIIDVSEYITEISPKEGDRVNFDDSAYLLDLLKTTAGVLFIFKYCAKNKVNPAHIKTLFNRPLGENSCKTLGDYVLEAAIFNPRVRELLKAIHKRVSEYLQEHEGDSLEDENISSINETYAADKILVKTFGFDFNSRRAPSENIDFHWDQLQDPHMNRPIKKRRNKTHTHEMRVNPRTGEREDHPQFKRQRPSVKHESHDTIKKTSLTLEPRDGKIRLYHTTRGVGLLYDRDDCNMKNEKYVWRKNMMTNGQFWLNDTTHRNNKSMEMDDLIAYINEIDRRGGRIVRSHNEILACPSLKSVKAVCTLSGQVDSLITAVYCQQYILFKYGVYLPIVRHDSELGKKIYTIDEIVDVLESRDVRNKTLGKDSVERWFDTLFSSYGNTSYYSSYNNFIIFLKDHSMYNVDQLRLYFFEESLGIATDVTIQVLNMLRHGGFSINQVPQVFEALARKQTQTNIENTHAGRRRNSPPSWSADKAPHSQRKHVRRRRTYSQSKETGRRRTSLVINNGHQDAICLLAQYCITRTNSVTRKKIIEHQQEFLNLTSLESMAPLLWRLGLEEMADVLRAYSYRQELSSRNAMNRSHRDSDDATNDEDDSMCMHSEMIIPTKKKRRHVEA